MALVQAFLNFRHRETVSPAVFTLLKSTNRWIGALFSSVSKTVLRQSSMASLMAVTHRITIRGAALSAGFEAPKIGKIYSARISEKDKQGTEGNRTPRIMMNKKYMLATL